MKISRKYEVFDTRKSERRIVFMTIDKCLLLLFVVISLSTLGGYFVTTSDQCPHIRTHRETHRERHRDTYTRTHNTHINIYKRPNFHFHVVKFIKFQENPRRCSKITGCGWILLFSPSHLSPILSPKFENGRHTICRI